MTASENGPPWYIGHANDVSLAVAARDAAIERADQQMAARFAGEARDAIATAVKAGVTLDELAEEIGYSDGAEAMDGPHIDRQIADMHDNGPAFALGSLPESQEGWPRWLEVTEVSVGDDYVIEVVHGTPDMVAGAWSGPPTADTATGEDGIADDRPAAVVAALRERFTAARDDAVSRHASEAEGGEEYAGVDGAPDAAQDVVQDQDTDRGDGSEAALGT
jgi:hypothetical protein